ncbi:MAG: DUF354 domain-containing protein [Nitrososphaerota archaeon]|nr:DUF354 domain-containing protein [Nitrososphaerota archaeon]MDG6939259.1 DUF354 domain-containing protein [Nitrososphaerota archaeon]
MRVWIDALTPKQLIFSGRLRKKLEERGHEVLLTTRDYHDANYVVTRLALEAEVVGFHGGGGRERKLEASLKRSADLLRVVLERRPALALSFGSPEAARVASGLGTPHWCVNDSPHSEWVGRLTVPLSELVFCPWVVPASAWSVYGLKRKRVRQYRALDPAAWLKDRGWWPPATDFERLSAGAILFRPPETQASYLRGRAAEGVELARTLSERFPESRLIVLPRYAEQEEEYADAPGVTVAGEPFFGPNMLRDCRLLVGGGGTMNAEAALLGVPAVSSYPGDPTYVDKYLVSRGLLHRGRGPADILRLALRLLTEDAGAKGERELELMDDPAEFVAAAVDRGAA